MDASSIHFAQFINSLPHMCLQIAQNICGQKEKSLQKFVKVFGFLTPEVRDPYIIIIIPLHIV